MKIKKKVRTIHINGWGDKYRGSRERTTGPEFLEVTDKNEVRMRLCYHTHSYYGARGDTPTSKGLAMSLEDAQRLMGFLQAGLDAATKELGLTFKPAPISISLGMEETVSAYIEEEEEPTSAQAPAADRRRE